MAYFNNKLIRADRMGNKIILAVAIHNIGISARQATQALNYSAPAPKQHSPQVVSHETPYADLTSALLVAS